MALYTVDMRDGAVRRLTEGYNGPDNQRLLIIEARSAKQAWVKAGRSSAATGSADCDCCHHRHCNDCEECSVAKQCSDYWICHCCGELNHRMPSSNLREVSYGLGKN